VLTNTAGFHWTGNYSAVDFPATPPNRSQTFDHQASGFWGSVSLVVQEHKHLNYYSIFILHLAPQDQSIAKSFATLSLSRSWKVSHGAYQPTPGEEADGT
jgi:hypothetical protein